MGKRWNGRAGWQAIGLTFALLGGNAHAAQQGSIGPASSGSVGISVSIPAQARISGFRDIDLGAGEPARLARATQDLCVSSNGLAREYAMVAHGSGSAGAFELSNGARTIGYTVEWSSHAAGRKDEPPASVSPATDRQAAVSPPECKAGPGTTLLTVAVDPALLQQAETGAPYTGSLTLTLAPL